MAHLSFEEIKKLVPQRFPMLMVDRVLEFQSGKRLVAQKNVSGNELVIQAHFPRKAIFPGAFILEGLSQCSIILFELSTALLPDDAIPLFGAVKGRFLKPVVPGDILIYHVEADKILPQAGIFRGRAEVDGVEVARAELSMAVTFERTESEAPLGARMDSQSNSEIPGESLG